MTDGEKGQTALHKAAWFQRRTICVMLVSAGASLTKTDFQGKTPRIQVNGGKVGRKEGMDVGRDGRKKGRKEGRKEGRGDGKKEGMEGRKEGRKERERKEELRKGLM